MKDKSNAMLNTPLEPVPVTSLKDDILNYIREYLPDNMEDLPILHNDLPTSITITIHHHNKKHTVATWQKDIQEGGNV